ncbi:Fc.00g011660.m01.CDS01 [Cosmosporella sp. VM-42]
MSGQSVSSAWVGAPPVCEDGFAFANSEFFAEASGHHRHRRATPAELKTHFTSGSDKDRPAHWFEAQLIHYGLQPSKTKSVARMRLFDAVNAGKLTVPSHVTKLEGKLKKEWVKKDREAKKALKEVSVPATKKTPAKKTAGVKREAGDNGSSSQGASKKPKTATPKDKAKTATPRDKAKTTTPKAKPASKAAAATAPARPKLASRAARRGGISQGPSRSTPAALPPPAPAPRTKQTARRSGAFMARGRIPAPPAPPSQDTYHDNSGGFDYDDSPPAYTEFDEGSHSDDYDEETYGDSYGEDTALAPLGLLNGRYDVSCPFVTQEWPHYGEDFGIVLTLAGSSLWGSFDLGVIEGVLLLDERPWESSHDLVGFRWRGREGEGQIMYGSRNQGWIKFLGDGRIEGKFDYHSIAFKGRRCPGQGTRSEIDARTLQDEWDGYSEEQYEQERVARWR